jgi:hypothetical protein
METTNTELPRIVCPHADSTWPDTEKVAEELMSGLPADAVYKIMCGNAIRMLKLEGD